MSYNAGSGTVNNGDGTQTRTASNGDTYTSPVGERMPHVHKVGDSSSDWVARDASGVAIGSDEVNPIIAVAASIASGLFGSADDAPSPVRQGK